MSRIQFITHKGKKILYLDFSNCKPDEVIKIIDDSRSTFQSQPENSLYVLDNATNAYFNAEVAKALGEWMERNKPYVKCAALFGASPMLKIILSAAEKSSKRQLKVCDSEEEAKDWLASQA